MNNIEKIELFNRVRAVLGLKEKELAPMTLVQTIEKLVEVIEHDRANK